MIRVNKYRRGASGYWYIRYWIGGRQLDESTRTRSEAAAETCRLRREIEMNAGIQPVRQAEVGALAAKYLDALPSSTSEIHRHEATRILNGFLKVCGRKQRDDSHRLRSEQLTPGLIDQYIRRRQTVRLHTGESRDSRGRRVKRTRPISNVTLRKELRYLSGFFNWCCRQRPPYLRENPIPLSNAGLIRSDAKPHFMVTDEELRALLRVCESPRQYLFLLLGWWTGGRRSEILGLHYYHFDFPNGTVDIAHGKNNMHSRLPTSKQIVELVQQLYSQTKEADRLFPTDPMPYHVLARLCRKAGIRHHRFHDLRISTSMKIKCGGFDAGLAGLWVGNQAATNRAHYTDLTAVAKQIGAPRNRISSRVYLPA